MTYLPTFNKKKVLYLLSNVIFTHIDFFFNRQLLGSSKILIFYIDSVCIITSMSFHRLSYSCRAYTFARSCVPAKLTPVISSPAIKSDALNAPGTTWCNKSFCKQIRIIKTKSICYSRSLPRYWCYHVRNNIVNIITPISKRGFSRNLFSARSGPPSCTNSALNALSVGTNTVNGPIIEVKNIKMMKL